MICFFSGTEEYAMPQIGEILREGKGKKVYATDDPDKAIVYFKDEACSQCPS